MDVKLEQISPFTWCSLTTWKKTIVYLSNGKLVYNVSNNVYITQTTSASHHHMSSQDSFGSANMLEKSWCNIKDCYNSIN